MKGDIIKVEQFSLSIAEKIVLHIISNTNLLQQKSCISIAGESGSGKSSTAVALKKTFDNNGINSILIQQDDYFFLPPKTNEKNRKESLLNIGIQEVNLPLLDKTILEFKQGAKKITKPLISYNDDSIESESLLTDCYSLLIVEGTYTSLLKNVDCKLFINRDFSKTTSAIKMRGRDHFDDFLLSVLKIEHKIISAHMQFADIIIGEKDIQKMGVLK
jgi:uridine kinase